MEKAQVQFVGCGGGRKEDGSWKTVVDKISGQWELCFVERPVCV